MYFFNKKQKLFDYSIFPQNLEDNTINEILNLTLDIDSNHGLTNDSNSSRTSQIKWIDYSQKSNNLFNTLSSIIAKTNELNFNFEIVSSQDSIQYTEYYSSEKGKYNWHQDLSSPLGPPYRKLSLTIQLSDPNEYEGGDLEIYIPHPENGQIITVPKEKGNIVVFPSYMWHRVTPVTKGIRKSLVWWVGGSQFR